MNRKTLFILCFILLLSLSVSNISSVAYANDVETKIAAQQDKGTGKVYLDLKPALYELGYTEDTYALAPQRLIERLLRIPAPSIPNKDGTYNATVNLNSKELSSLTSTIASPTNITSPTLLSSTNLERLNTTNRDSVCTTKLSFAGNTQTDISNANVPLNDSESNFGMSIDTAIGSAGIKACLIVAIWEYPGDQMDLWPAADIYDAINDHITGYDHVERLVNEDATYQMVWQMIASLCMSYTDVDVYLIGHGGEVWLGYNCYYYACYDAWDDLFGPLWWNGLYSWDFISYGEHAEYDFSALRMGVATCCYGGHLSYGFLNPGGNIEHYRAFAGPDDIAWTDCETYFIESFGDSWYGSEGSWESYLVAYDAAEPYIHDGVNFSYDDTGVSIYYDFYVLDVYDWGCLSGQGNAWDASDLIGQNDDDYAHIYGGNYGDAGVIFATMNTASHGEVVAYGYGNSGYYGSHLYCYVSYGGSTWYALPNNPVTVNYWDGLYYIDFGNAPIYFTHIAFVGYNDNGYSVSLNLDAVHAVN